MRLPVLISFLLVSSSVLGQTSIPPATADKLRDLYLQRLDAWVSSGGDVSTVQRDVVTNCGKLMYLRDPSMGQATSPALKEALDTRVDVCTKMTVHRAHPQPEFAKPEIVRITCGTMTSEEPVFARLCASASLKP